MMQKVDEFWDEKLEKARKGLEELLKNIFN